MCILYSAQVLIVDYSNVGLTCTVALIILFSTNTLHVRISIEIVMDVYLVN